MTHLQYEAPRAAELRDAAATLRKRAIVAQECSELGVAHARYLCSLATRCREHRRHGIPPLISGPGARDLEV